MSGIGKIPYIKISRTDGNGIDITSALEALETIVMPLSTGNKSFSILNRTKEPEYFLFYVSMTGTEDIPAADKSSPNYSFSGSYNVVLSSFRGTPPITVTVDNHNFFLTGSTSNLGPGLGTGVNPIDSYRITTLPAKNIGIHISSSFNVFIDASGKYGDASITASARILSNPLTPGSVPSNPTVLSTSVITQSFQDLSSVDFIYSGSYEVFSTISASQFTPGDCLYFDIDFFAPEFGDLQPTSATFNNGIFEISSSAAVINPKDMSVEPYFTSPFYGTDCDVMYGDVSQGVSNPFFQDVDYSVGIITPTNYIALRDNTATKAVVPQSMFTINSLINPGYGSKNQSEKINEWTKSFNNIGTYGKTSPVDSLKSLVVYCDWIGGNTPEKHNSQTAHIQYIINEDGRINEPNLLDTSIGNVQQAFETNQNLIVNLTDPPIGQGMEVLNGLNNIDRGGYRIEPILYTQSGSLYTGDGDVYWTGSVLVGSTLGSGSIDDVMTNAIMSADQAVSSDGVTFNTINFDTQTQEPASVTNPYNTTNKTYTVPVEAVNDGLVLTFNVRVAVYAADTLAQARLRIINTTTGDVIANNASDDFINGIIAFPPTYPNTVKVFILSGTVSNPVAGHVYEVQARGSESQILIESNDGPSGGLNPAFFSVTQIPAPFGGGFTVGENSIWGYPSTSDFSVITASQAGLNNSYGIYSQTDIPNSGFKTISEKWSLKSGDEFRFEDREDRVFMVQSVVPPSSHPSGTLEVQLDKPIPTASINLDHFLIRRYVEDGSIILFDGSKPAGSSGPSIIKPQYVTQTLTKGVDEYILDLTDKGLIT
tara:strand:+ start:757 stop:3222 length:2466 start_codon:yes stop_codon:yes gene_type:complete